MAWADAPQRYEELLGPTVAGRLVAEGLENRNKARAAAKRWTTFYASDLEALSSECAGSEATVCP